MTKDKIEWLKLNATKKATLDPTTGATSDAKVLELLSSLDLYVQKQIKQLEDHEKKHKKLQKEQYYWSYIILIVLFSVITLSSCLDILCSESELLHQAWVMVMTFFVGLSDFLHRLWTYGLL